MQLHFFLVCYIIKIYSKDCGMFGCRYGKDQTMKKFFKDNSYLIVKLVVFQLGIMIMGIITGFATVNMEATWVYPASSIFCVAFYLFLICTIGYENGQKDGIRIESGKMKLQPMRYFVVGLVANSLNILLGLLTVFFRLMINAPFFGRLQTGMIYTPGWARDGYVICNMIARGIQSMYLGITQTLSFENPIFLLIIPFPAILAFGISYHVGVKYKDGFKNQKEEGPKGSARYR